MRILGDVLAGTMLFVGVLALAWNAWDYHRVRRASWEAERAREESWDSIMELEHPIIHISRHPSLMGAAKEIRAGLGYGHDDEL